MKAGVFQNPAGKWTFYSAQDQVTGPEFEARGDARDAYQEHRKTLMKAAPESAAPAEAPSTPPATADTTEEAPVAEEKKSKKAPKAKKEKKAKSGKPRKDGAVAKVWEIANDMPKAARKDVIAACVKAGINENTAKTQYQRWLHRNEK